MSIRLRFRIVDSTTVDSSADVQTIAYSYIVYREQREILAYQWDPLDSRAGIVAWPHVHVGKELHERDANSRAREQMDWLAAAHIPTGLVPFGDVFRMLVRDLGVEILRHHGEPQEAANQRADRTFGQANAALRATFAWRTGD
jgi:hypothetical protein